MCCDGYARSASCVGRVVGTTPALLLELSGLTPFDLVGTGGDTGAGSRRFFCGAIGNGAAIFGSKGSAALPGSVL